MPSAFLKAVAPPLCAMLLITVFNFYQGILMAQEKVLPFIEHLVELRKRLIVIVIAVVIGMGIAWNFSNDLLSFIEKPITGKTYLTELKKSVYSEVKVRFPSLYKRYELDKEMIATVKDRRLNYSAPLEPFFVQCKISCIAGFIIVLPVVFYQVWLFIAPGLTFREKKLVVPFVTASTITFCIGALFFLFIIWPVIINFSLSYEMEGLQSWFNLSAYVNFCLRLILIFGLIFELPVIALTAFPVRVRFVCPSGQKQEICPFGERYSCGFSCRSDYHVCHHGAVVSDV